MYDKTPFDPHGAWSKEKKKNPHEVDFYKWKVPTPPKPATINDLFPRLDQWAIGFGEIFNLLAAEAKHTPSSFPPYNLAKVKDTYVLEVALAGYRKEDIEVTQDDRVVTIKNVVADLEEDPEGYVSIHHGIAQRAFTQRFTLADYVFVKSAKMEDGILTVTFETNIPEEKKPKVIDIN